MVRSRFFNAKSMALWLLAGALALPVAASAQPTPTPTTPAPAAPVQTIDTLATMVTNMGYEISQPAPGKAFSITVHGQYDVIINFIMGTGTAPTATLYVYLQSYTPAEMPKLDMSALLQSNNVWVSYFTLGKTKDDFDLYLQRILPAVAISPVTIRATIENLQSVTYQTNATWNKRVWK